MNQSESLKFCKQWLPTWTGNQPDSLIQFYADDIYYQDPAYPQGIQGKAQLQHYFRKLLAKYPDWIWQVVEVFPYDHGFILKWRAKIANTPEAKEFFGLDVVAVNNGKIIRNEVYFDPSPLR